MKDYLEFLVFLLICALMQTISLIKFDRHHWLLTPYFVNFALFQHKHAIWSVYESLHQNRWLLYFNVKIGIPLPGKTVIVLKQTPGNNIIVIFIMEILIPR